jgi:hypothetical protein
MDVTKSYTLYFDEFETKKLKTRKYVIYRSVEDSDNSPIIDGVYLQRKELDFSPPQNISVTLEW